MNDVRKVIYGTIVLFLVVVSAWISGIYLFSCGLSFTCRQAAPLVDRTSIPTLIPAALPISTKYVAPVPTATPIYTALPPESETHPLPGGNPDIARPSNPGGPGPAVDLTGSIDSGKDIFAQNCAYCHAAEGVGGLPNPGSTDGTVPPLNPIDETLKSDDYKTFATNIDLFIEHGSTPEGVYPVRNMPAWGDRGALSPQQIADVIAYIINLNK